MKRVKQRQNRSVVRLGGGAHSALLRCGLVTHKGPLQETDFCTQQYAMVYVAEGVGWYQSLKGERLPIQSGDIFQRYPGQRHTVMLEDCSYRCYIAVPAQVYDLFSLMGAPRLTHPVIGITDHELAEKGFARIYTTLSQATPQAFAQCLVQMQDFMLALLQAEPETHAGVTPDPPIAEAMRILSADLGQSLSMPEVARRVHLSYSRFRQRFVQQTGFSPGDYRIHRRIEQAMALLSHKDSTLKGIADELGYADVYAFCAQFKKLTGMPPGAFRKETFLLSAEE